MNCKKLISILLCTVLFFSLSACKKSSPKSSSATMQPTYAEAPTTSQVSKKNWAKESYRDEFGEPTSESYISNLQFVTGQFSNSATSGSELKARLLVDTAKISIQLFEYGNSMVKNASSYSDDLYNIILQDSNGTKYNISGKMYKSSVSIVIDQANKDTVLNALKSGGQISFYIEDAERTIRNYRFTLDTAGFAEAYKTL